MKVFPKEIIENTTHSYLPKNQVRSKVIYSLILLLIIAALALLPIIKIQLYSSAVGLVKPEKERIGITSLQSGKVLYTAMLENKLVHKGDTLLILHSNLIDEQIDLTDYQLSQIDNEVKDLKYLVNEKGNDVLRLVSAKYQKELIEYNEKVDEHFTRIKKLKVDFNRKKKLLSRGVIAQVEFDNIQFDFDIAKNAFYQLKKRQLNSWQAMLSDLERKQHEVQNKKDQLKENKNEYVVTAPIEGNLINVAGLEIGSLITSGTVLAQITPNTDLIAEFYVSPFDIGLIDKNKKVNFQIDAFNYNQWGQVSGNILEIGGDAEFINNEPLFKVRCQMDKAFLALPNGRKGYIKKGMTLRARFSLAERTLYQLLYDKVDDWLHP